MGKLLTVFGATGQQGGNLIDYVLRHPELSTIYRIRGVTRDVTKPAALALREKGVDVVSADMDDHKSLRNAVEGSYVVFAMTNFWEKACATIEIAQGRAIADASVAAGVTFLLWSTLPNVTKMTGGKLSGVQHFDSKASVETYIRGLPIKSAFYMPAFYMQNFNVIFKPKPNANGELEFAQTWSPDTRIPLIDITDTGKFLAPVLLDPERYIGKIMTAATAYYTGPEMAGIWTDVTGRKVAFVQIPGGTTMGNLSPEMVRTLKESSGLMKDYSYYGTSGPKNLEWTLEQMEEKPTTWEEFVRANQPWFDDIKAGYRPE